MGCLCAKDKDVEESSVPQQVPARDLDFLMRATSFPEETIVEWYNFFILQCPSGQMNKEQFVIIYELLFPKSNAKDFCNHCFKTFDRDNSGYIDYSEFLQALNLYTSQSVDDKLAWTFQFYDVDGNGRIEREELEMAIEMMMTMRGETGEAGETAQQIADRIFRNMDVNNDGYLSEEEFMQGCMTDKKLFQLLVR
ncbi:unnamed protein product [Notodromas monacha]|uniref:EF-hand domain-containing protein n=1 Tax=Notodromas monacha TaxID=399045 RepID=A0A7R9BV54_9CRUS|nr:unnamed protein product [Notodromas monacha]CAG0920702.1 unnamed protein product [Notodromas monacha]